MLSLTAKRLVQIERLFCASGVRSALGLLRIVCQLDQATRARAQFRYRHQPVEVARAVAQIIETTGIWCQVHTTGDFDDNDTAIYGVAQAKEREFMRKVKER